VRRHISLDPDPTTWSCCGRCGWGPDVRTPLAWSACG